MLVVDTDGHKGELVSLCQAGMLAAEREQIQLASGDWK